MEACWSQDPNDRPPFSEIVMKIKPLIVLIQIEGNVINVDIHKKPIFTQMLTKRWLMVYHVRSVRYLLIRNCLPSALKQGIGGLNVKSVF